jgi:hypothetical protein
MQPDGGACQGRVPVAQDALYEEKVSSRRTQAVFGTLTLLLLIVFAWRATTTGLNAVGVALLFLSLFFLFCSLNYRTLLIRLTTSAVTLRFGVFTWTMPLDNVDQCRLDELPAFMKYGGAGIHFMFIRGRYRVSFNLLEYPRVVVALRRPHIVRDVSFTTRRPSEVISLLNAVKPARSAETPSDGRW